MQRREKEEVCDNRPRLRIRFKRAVNKFNGDMKMKEEERKEQNIWVVCEALSVRWWWNSIESCDVAAAAASLASACVAMALDCRPRATMPEWSEKRETICFSRFSWADHANPFRVPAPHVRKGKTIYCAFFFIPLSRNTNTKTEEKERTGAPLSGR